MEDMNPSNIKNWIYLCDNRHKGPNENKNDKTKWVVCSGEKVKKGQKLNLQKENYHYHMHQLAPTPYDMPGYHDFVNQTFQTFQGQVMFKFKLFRKL